MRSTFLFIFVFFLFSGTNAQTLQWAKGLVGPGSASCWSIATDANGNVYISGMAQDSIDLDPGPGTAFLNTPYTIFFAKYSPAGNYLWSNTLDVQFCHIEIDPAGNLCLVGIFLDTADFDPGPGVYNLINTGTNKDTYMAKYDPSGNLMWAKNIGGPGNATLWTNSFNLDKYGNFYLVGYFVFTNDFDPDTGSVSISPPGIGSDCFIAKYDASGNYAWVKTMGNGNGASPFGVDISPAGDVFVAGCFAGMTDFDPSATTVNVTSNGMEDIFFAKYDAMGNYQWVKKVGGSKTDYAYAIELDSLGNIFLTGMFTGMVDFNPGTGTANLDTYDFFIDSYIAKYDPVGNYLWAVNFGDQWPDHGFSIALDTAGDVYAIGRYQGNDDFDFGTGTNMLPNCGTSNGYGYVTRYSASGNHVWAHAIETTTWNLYGKLIDVDKLGNIYLTGLMNTMADFDMDTTVFMLSPVDSLAGANGFIAKYSQYPGFVTNVPTSNNESNIQVIYPNPANESVTLSFVKEWNGAVSLFDTSGRIIATRTIEKERETVFELEGLCKGIYFLQGIDKTGNVFTQKLIKTQ